MADWDTRVIGWVNRVRQQSRGGVSPPAVIRDIRLLLDEMRLFKSADELQVMRHAARISADAHRRAMRSVRPGMREYEVEAELLHEFRRHGAEAPAYTPIVAGGANACILHYVENNARLAPGDLLLIDAGCELNGYAADITRTFPVDGKFGSGAKGCLPAGAGGASGCDQRSAPRKSVGWRLIRRRCGCWRKVSWISAFAAAAWRRSWKRRTTSGFTCTAPGTGWDWMFMMPGEYKQDGAWRPLQPGMTLTVEPGCYIRPAENVPQHFWNIGVRIEDDVAVTESGCEVLTSAAPKSVAEIEGLMQHREA